MKMRILALMLAVLMLLTLCGCMSSEHMEEDREDASAGEFMQQAKEFVKNGDLEGAIKTLEVGISMTDDPELKAYLDGILAAQTADTTPTTEPATQEEVPDYKAYTGEWINWNTLAILYIELYDDVYTLRFGFGQDSAFFAEAPVSNLKGDTLLVHVPDDQSGASGDIQIQFREESVYCTVTNLVPSGYKYGIELFDDTELIDLSQDDEPEDNYSLFQGKWCCGSAELEITYTDSGYTIQLAEYVIPYVSSFEVPFSCFSELDGIPVISFYVADDGYDGSGTLNLYFVGDSVTGEVLDLKAGKYGCLLELFDGLTLERE